MQTCLRQLLNEIASAYQFPAWSLPVGLPMLLNIQISAALTFTNRLISLLKNWQDFLAKFDGQHTKRSVSL